LGHKFNVSIKELLGFIIKSKVEIIAARFIDKIEVRNNLLRVSFFNLKNILYWPVEYKLDKFYQVCVETFDKDNWHRYECCNTIVAQNDVVVDVGAGEGLFSISVLDRCKKIFIIEPDRLFFMALKETFRGYPLEKVELFNLAAGDRETKVVMHQDGISSNITKTSCGDIQMTTLDALLMHKGRIDYIKADIEGYEIRMLVGATGIIKEYKPKMAIACYHNNNDYLEMINFISNLVPEYKCILRGVTQFGGKPVIAHFYI
jgi:FkbM family methyltransferase